MIAKRTFGGAQPGAGRPATGRTGKTTTVYASEHTLKVWEAIAAKKRQKKSQVISDAIELLAEREGVQVLAEPTQER